MNPENKYIVRNMFFESHEHRDLGRFYVKVVCEPGLWKDAFNAGRHVLHEKLNDKNVTTMPDRRAQLDYDIQSIRHVDEVQIEPLPEGYEIIPRHDVKAETIFIMNTKSMDVISHHPVYEEQSIAEIAGSIATMSSFE